MGLTRYIQPFALREDVLMYTERYEPRCGAVSDVAHTAIQMVNVAPTKAILSLSSLDREQ